jgi:hypothetical protein
MNFIGGSATALPIFKNFSTKRLIFVRLKILAASGIFWILFFVVEE